MTNDTVGSFIKNEKGINNVDLLDTDGNLIATSYDSYGFTSYFDIPIKSATIEDRGNFGYVAMLTI